MGLEALALGLIPLVAVVGLAALFGFRFGRRERRKWVETVIEERDGMARQNLALVNELATLRHEGDARVELLREMVNVERGHAEDLRKSYRQVIDSTFAKLGVPPPHLEASPPSVEPVLGPSRVWDEMRGEIERADAVAAEKKRRESMLEHGSPMKVTGTDGGDLT